MYHTTLDCAQNANEKYPYDLSSPGDDSTGSFKSPPLSDGFGDTTGGGP